MRVPNIKSIDEIKIGDILGLSRSITRKDPDTHLFTRYKRGCRGIVTYIEVGYVELSVTTALNSNYKAFTANENLYNSTLELHNPTAYLIKSSSSYMDKLKNLDELIKEKEDGR